MIVEEHRRTGGLFSILSQYISINGLSKNLAHVSLPDSFLISGSYEELTEHYGLDVHGISERLSQLLSEL